jgi:exonuclease SbcD
MRLLHTSDWHLGRSFHRVGLLDAQAAFAREAAVMAGDDGVG